MPGLIELTDQQRAFLADLRQAPRRAAAHLDALMVGPLIRANLVQCDDEPGEAARHREPPGSIFTLTGFGARHLAGSEAI